MHLSPIAADALFSLPSLHGWDFALIAIVSLHATLVAYVYRPQWKAFLMTLPIPFTLASLSLGKPIDAANALGLALLLLFAHAVRLMHGRLRVPIIPAIALGAAGYCGAAMALRPLAPATDAAFWAVCATVGAAALGALLLTPARVEEGHRTPLPVYVKLPAVAAVILLLVLIKSSLGGFMTMFPMVGLVTAYEARRSLWTICRQMPVLILMLLPMLAAVRLAQGTLGLGWALAIGWTVYLMILTPYARRVYRATGEDARGTHGRDAHATPQKPQCTRADW